ncbi:hypothetical protein V2I21_00215 [Campylobacter sp. CLAX-22107-21]|uniref:hypothetical protein n=1 Tax=Campylobacter devanensis TaxID=3161138 RepID=UPI000A35B5C9|nr:MULTISPECIES: hypothetical protein [unclassified Campylobacter]MEE3693559.1 hypothetical protein [Campylobacter sp. CLAX-22107-21]
MPLTFISFSGESKQCVNLLKTLKDDFIYPTAYALGLLLDKNAGRICSLEFNQNQPKNLQIYTSAFSLLKALNNNLCSNWNIDSTLRWNWTLNDSN